MKIIAALLACTGVAWAGSPGDWSLQTLFTRPFVWGTPPSAAAWSKHGHTLAFLWNAEGRRFLDLYAWNPDTKKLARLTDLEHLRDDLNRGEAETDERERAYLMPDGGIGGFDLTQDGSQAAFSYKGDVWTVRTDGSVPPFRLTHTKTAETNPQFSPDGARLAYLRAGALLAQDLHNGQLLQLAPEEDVTWFRWSPDGKHLAYGTRGARGRQLPLPNYSGKMVAARPFARSLAGDGPTDAKRYVIDALAENAQPLALDAGTWGAKVWAPGTLDWSPDGRHLLGLVLNPDLKRAQILVFDAETGKSKAVFEHKDATWVDQIQFGWSPDSSQVWFTCDADGWLHLYRVSAVGGKLEQVTRGNWEIRSEQSIYPQKPQWVGQYLYYTSTEEGTAQRHFYRIKPDGSGKERLSAGEGIQIGIVSEDGEHRAELRAGLAHPIELYVDGSAVTHRTGPKFAAYRWPETQFISFPSRGDGATVQAKMLLPEGYSVSGSEKKWPAIFFIHGSGIATSVLAQWGSYQEFRYVFNSYLAHRGYVVFDLDYRGSTGYGRAWRSGVYLNMGGPDLDDVLGEIDFATKLANIDMRRIGIWGVSYGGFMTDMAMFRAPDAFHAGAAFSAVNDWENYNAEYTEERLNRPEDNPEAYRRSSPLWFSQHLKNPLLIVHGFVDDNVLFQDAVQLTEKLVHEGRRFDEIFYPEESHGFMRDETLIDCFQRASDFFDKNLFDKNPAGN
jgi:dipeptidyl aminopeptidase/acylaminoacyl peptidase